MKKLDIREEKYKLTSVDKKIVNFNKSLSLTIKKDATINRFIMR